MILTKDFKVTLTCTLRNAVLGEVPPEFDFSGNGLTFYFTDGSYYFFKIDKGETKDQIAQRLEQIAKCLKQGGELT